MLSIMCILCPSLITISTEKYLLNTKEDIKTSLMNYGIYCLINNVITIALSVILFDINVNIEQTINLYPGFAVKYACISIAIAILLSFIKIIVVKNIGVELEVKNKKNN